MAYEFSGFFLGSGEEELTYDAGELSTAMRILGANGVTGLGANLRVSVEGDTLRTVVSPGAAAIQGYFYQLKDDGTGDMFFSHAKAAASSGRIDRIIVRLDLSARRITVNLKQGVPSSSPVPPMLTRNEEIYEMSLASVTVRPGATALVDTDIIDERKDEDLCGCIAPDELRPSRAWDSIDKRAATEEESGLMSREDKAVFNLHKQALHVDEAERVIDVGGRAIHNAVIPMSDNDTSPVQAEILRRTIFYSGSFSIAPGAWVKQADGTHIYSETELYDFGQKKGMVSATAYPPERDEDSALALDFLVKSMSFSVDNPTKHTFMVECGDILPTSPIRIVVDRFYE